MNVRIAACLDLCQRHSFGVKTESDRSVPSRHKVATFRGSCGSSNLIPLYSSVSFHGLYLHMGIASPSMARKDNQETSHRNSAIPRKQEPLFVAAAGVAIPFRYILFSPSIGSTYTRRLPRLPWLVKTNLASSQNAPATKWRTVLQLRKISKNYFSYFVIYCTKNSSDIMYLKEE